MFRRSPDHDGPDFLAYLRAWSPTMRLAEVTAIMGREPTWSRDIGDPLLNGNPRESSLWEIDLDFDEGVHRGCYGLTDAISRLPVDLADRAAAMADRGGEVTLQVVQYIDPEDPFTDGIHLEPEAVAWLTRARAAIDIDQYAEDASLPRAVRLLASNARARLSRGQWLIHQQVTARLPQRTRRSRQAPGSP